MTGVGSKDSTTSEAARKASRILAEHEKFMRAVIHFQAGGQFDEEDLFQDFYLTLICRPLPADVRSTRSYLYRAITSHIADVARQGACYRRHLKKYAEEKRISIHNRPATTAYLKKELTDGAIDYIVRHLQNRQAQAVALRYREGYSVAEIADRMGVRRRTASRYLCQALKALRQLWGLHEGSAYEKP